MKDIPLVSNRLVKTVAIFSCIQALLWVALAITGLIFFNCGIELKETNPAQLLEITYFYNVECKEPPSYLKDYWNPTETPSKSSRTHTALVWFIVSGTVRALMSIALAVAAGMRRRLATAAGVLFWCWLLVDVACILVDAVYAVMFALDGSDTKSLAELLDDERLNEFMDTSKLWALSVPPIIMALACSRFVIFWLMDMILVFVAIYGACRARSTEEFVSPPNAARNKHDVPLRYTAAKANNPTTAEEAAAVAAIAAVADEAAAEADAKLHRSSNLPEYEPVGPSASVVKFPDQLKMAGRTKNSPYYSPAAVDYEPVGNTAKITSAPSTPSGSLKVDVGKQRNSNTYVNAPASSNSEYDHIYEPVDYSGSAVAEGEKQKEKKQKERLEHELREQERWRQERKEEDRREYEGLEHVRREQELREQELQRRAMEEREAVAAAAVAAADAEQERKERERKEKERERKEQLRREREAAAAAAEKARKERELQQRERAGTNQEQRELELADRAKHERDRTAELAAEADQERRPKSGSILSNKSATAELNNQKPWSYFRPPLDELSQRRMSPAKLSLPVDGVEKPPVPVPDYNIFSPVERNPHF